MMKYIITWDAGYGKRHEIIEVDSQEEADQWAYDNWKEEAEINANYDAAEYDKEAAIDLGLEDEED